jgi:hypothetical protein
VITPTECMQASNALRKEEAAEAGRELRALLRLLTNLTQRDLLDFGSMPDGPRVDVAQVGTRSVACSLYIDCTQVSAYPATVAKLGCGKVPSPVAGGVPGPGHRGAADERRAAGGAQAGAPVLCAPVVHAGHMAGARRGAARCSDHVLIRFQGASRKLWLLCLVPMLLGNAPWCSMTRPCKS